MPRILVILIAVVVLLFLVDRFRRLPPASRQQVIKYLLIIGLIGGLAALALSGRLNWILALIGSFLALLPKMLSWLVKLLPALQPLMRQFQASHSGMGPRINTDYLQISLNLKTRQFDGAVIKGEFKGRQLSGMSVEEITRLLQACQQQDLESAAILVAYLDRYHKGWSSGQGDQYKAQQDYAPQQMNRRQASEILGVAETASKEDVIAAHRRLIQKLHPDRGGSDYLAAKINQAKDVLLG